MISILLCTRKRFEMLKRFVDSVINTAERPDMVEFVIYIDDDDPSYDNWIKPPQVKIVRGPRQIASKCYKWKKAKGPIYAWGSDDFIFHTKGWDTKVREEFEKYPDRIVLVYGDDGDPNPNSTNATFGFIHRNWIEAVGRFFPPYFSGDFPDTWISEIAALLNRKKKIDIYTEHIHPSFGKREKDITDREKWEKHFKEKMPQKYLNTRNERIEEAKKLLTFIEYKK